MYSLTLNRFIVSHGVGTDNPNLVALLVEQIDINRDGAVSFKELEEFLWPANPEEAEFGLTLQYVRRAVRQHVFAHASVESPETVLEAFATIGKVKLHNHTLDSSTLKKIFKELKIPEISPKKLSAKNVEKLTKSLDVNGDGVVSCKEFHDWLVAQRLTSMKKDAASPPDPKPIDEASKKKLVEDAARLGFSVVPQVSAPVTESTSTATESTVTTSSTSTTVTTLTANPIPVPVKASDPTEQKFTEVPVSNASVLPSSINVLSTHLASSSSLPLSPVLSTSSPTATDPVVEAARLGFLIPSTSPSMGVSLQVPNKNSPYPQPNKSKSSTPTVLSPVNSPRSNPTSSFINTPLPTPGVPEGQNHFLSSSSSTSSGEDVIKEAAKLGFIITSPIPLSTPGPKPSLTPITGFQGAQSLQIIPSATHEGFSVGQTVHARYKGSKKWFPGVISAVNVDGTFNVDYDDGDKDTMLSASDIRTPTKSEKRKTVEEIPLKSIEENFNFSQSTQVLALYPNDSVDARSHGQDWTPGKIASINQDGTYGVMYDDGSVENSVRMSNIRRPLSEKAVSEVASISSVFIPTITSPPVSAGGSSQLHTFSQNDLVEVKLEVKDGRMKWFSGKIHACNQDGSYAVLYRDGDKDFAVSADSIRLIPPRSRSRSRSPRGAASPVGSKETASSDISISLESLASNAFQLSESYRRSRAEEKSPMPEATLSPRNTRYDRSFPTNAEDIHLKEVLEFAAKSLEYSEQMRKEREAKAEAEQRHIIKEAEVARIEEAAIVEAEKKRIIEEAEAAKREEIARKDAERLEIEAEKCRIELEAKRLEEEKKFEEARIKAEKEAAELERRREEKRRLAAIEQKKRAKQEAKEAKRQAEVEAKVKAKAEKEMAEARERIRQKKEAQERERKQREETKKKALEAKIKASETDGIIKILNDRVESLASLTHQQKRNFSDLKEHINKILDKRDKDFKKTVASIEGKIKSLTTYDATDPLKKKILRESKSLRRLSSDLKESVIENIQSIERTRVFRYIALRNQNECKHVRSLSTGALHRKKSDFLNAESGLNNNDRGTKYAETEELRRKNSKEEKVRAISATRLFEDYSLGAQKEDKNVRKNIRKTLEERRIEDLARTPRPRKKVIRYGWGSVEDCTDERHYPAFRFGKYEAEKVLSSHIYEFQDFLNNIRANESKQDDGKVDSNDSDENSAQGAGRNEKITQATKISTSKKVGKHSSQWTSQKSNMRKRDPINRNVKPVTPLSTSASHKTTSNILSGAPEYSRICSTIEKTTGARMHTEFINVTTWWEDVLRRKRLAEERGARHWERQ